MDEVSRRILQAVVEEPGLTIHQLVQQTGEDLGRTRSRCHRLRDRGLVEQRPHGYFLVFHPTEQGRGEVE